MFEFEFKGLEMNKIGKLRGGEAKKIEFKLNLFGNGQNWEIEG